MTTDQIEARRQQMAMIAAGFAVSTPGFVMENTKRIMEEIDREIANYIPLEMERRTAEIMRLKREAAAAFVNPTTD